MTFRSLARRVVVVFCVVFLPAVAWAQSETGNIAGVVRDASGAVLPGVTVEAASPALIEKVRTVVTDSEGLYRIVDLRPGAYTVTFTLPGFSTFVRDGIELTHGVHRDREWRDESGRGRGDDHGDRGGSVGGHLERRAADHPLARLAR